MSESCLTCKAWKTADKKSGQCRALPPQMIVLPVQTIQGTALAAQGAWPQTASDCWCACYQDKETEKRMKLFVTGEISSDPCEWGHVSEKHLILARDEEEALTMTDLLDVVEVQMTNPTRL